MVVPAPLAAMKSAPQRGGLTSELRQVSILDLMQEMKEQQETTAREETLARSRHRPSLNNIKLPPLASPGEVAAEAPSAAEPPTASPVAAAPSLNAPQATVEGNKSGDVLEPTVDRQDLPVGFEPGQPSRVSVRGLEAPAPAAASANSAGAPPAVPAPSPSEPAGPVPPVPVDSARSPAAAPPVAPLSPAIEPTGGAASSTSPAAPAAAPLVKAAAPIPPVVPGELPRWAWLAVLGPLIAIILGLVVILLTR
jgi:hypothetical protein